MAHQKNPEIGIRPSHKRNTTTVPLSPRRLPTSVPANFILKQQSQRPKVCMRAYSPRLLGHCLGCWRIPMRSTHCDSWFLLSRIQSRLTLSFRLFKSTYNPCYRQSHRNTSQLIPNPTLSDGAWPCSDFEYSQRTPSYSPLDLQRPSLRAIDLDLEET